MTNLTKIQPDPPPTRIIPNARPAIAPKKFKAHSSDLTLEEVKVIGLPDP